MQLQAIIELDKEWNSREMQAKRTKAWGANHKPDMVHLEGVLEFLEKVSTLEKRGVISDKLIWDTFGWYVFRYYHYSTNAIAQFRTKYTNIIDPTLYGDLEALWNKLLECEIVERNKIKGSGTRALIAEEVRAELDKHMKEFIEAEKVDHT